MKQLMSIRTEKEKMLAGELYNCLDPDLELERQKAKALVWRYNQPAPTADRPDILNQLLGRIGQGTIIEPPFYCVYGWNILLGNHVYFNVLCKEPGSVTLDRRHRLFHGRHRLPVEGNLPDLGFLRKRAVLENFPEQLAEFGNDGVGPLDLRDHAPGASPMRVDESDVPAPPTGKSVSLSNIPLTLSYEGRKYPVGQLGLERDLYFRPQHISKVESAALPESEERAA